MKNATLCYVMNDEKVLLQKKAPGRFGEGKWNAPGGKIRRMESPVSAAIREVQEETGLEVRNLKGIGHLTFKEEDGNTFVVHVFTTDDFTGEARNSVEGEVKWFDTNNLPFENMWEDDSVWLPVALEGKKFRGEFQFTKGFKKMIHHKMEKI